MELELSADEQDLLLDLLRDQLSDLRAEIHRTEGYAFKEELKARAVLMEAIIGRLQGGPSAG